SAGPSEGDSSSHPAQYSWSRVGRWGAPEVLPSGDPSPRPSPESWPRVLNPFLFSRLKARSPRSAGPPSSASKLGGDEDVEQNMLGGDRRGLRIQNLAFGLAYVPQPVREV